MTVGSTLKFSLTQHAALRLVFVRLASIAFLNLNQSSKQMWLTGPLSIAGFS